MSMTEALRKDVAHAEPIMDTGNEECLADSPEMIFDNEFTDSEDESEDENVMHDKEIPSSAKMDIANQSERNIHATEEVAESHQSEFEKDFENGSIVDSPSPEIDASINRVLLPALQVKSISDDEDDNDKVAVDEPKLQGQSNDNTVENFASGWTLTEDDLNCLPFMLNKRRIEECKQLKLQEQSDSPAKGKGQKIKTNFFKKRAGKGSSRPRLIYTSPLTMIANIAKKSGYDLPTLLETSEFMGPSYQLPCMQCYEKTGGKVGASYGSLMGATSGETDSSNGRCSTCGGQVQTLATYGTMIRQMREIIEAKDLIPHDVYPDGNCLFAAIVDQLRVRGDFSFTPYSLRQSAVNYLRKNPTADDGTPLEMFLTDDEKWESYLARMSEDGEWGDHIILRALANVIDMKIVIYGGMTGQRETVLSPKQTPCEETKSDSEENPLEQSSLIYLGHVGESHYMSLRPKQWRQSLREDVQKRRGPTERPMIKCPLHHINFILRQIFRMDFIKSSFSESVDMIVPSRFKRGGLTNEMFGSMFCKMVPSKVKLESYGGPDISMFFPSVKEEAACQCFQTPTAICFKIPDDTDIVMTREAAGLVDLIVENDASVVGQVLLIPKKPRLWKGQTTVLDGTKICLKTSEMNPNFFEHLLPPKTEDTFGVYTVISFKCQWPDVAKEWPQRSRESAFPDPRTIQEVVQSGCHVIPLIQDAEMADVLDDPIHFMTLPDDYIWCYSFVSAEKEICRFVSSEQRQCFLIFRCLVDTTLKDIPLPSSVVRSIFFYACEKLDTQCWKSKPGECLLILLKKISDGFKNHFIPHYFMQEKNLLYFVPEETLADCSERLEYVRHQPVVALYFLLDQLNVMSSEIGNFVEHIFENINIEDQIGNKEGSSNQALLSAFAELLQNLIYQEDYHGAMLVFQDIIEEKGGTLNKDGAKVMKELLRGMFIDQQWCFALYVDMKQQTTLTAKICEGYDTVHVTEVFGPNCMEELPSTLVPEMFSIPQGDLIFIRMVSYLLSQNLSNKVHIGCMKFYLKEYAKLAGGDLFLPTTIYGTHMGKKSAASIHLSELQGIYVMLFNFCFYSYLTEEFREMMPLYTLIAEKIGSRLCLTNLQRMWSSLGERQKALDISKKLGGSVFSTLSGDYFSEYGLD